MQAVPLARAGVGSAVNDTPRNIGSVLGVAVPGSITASAYAAFVAGTAHAALAGELAGQHLQ